MSLAHGRKWMRSKIHYPQVPAEEIGKNLEQK
jgi:hypothetical protein